LSWDDALAVIDLVVGSSLNGASKGKALEKINEIVGNGKGGVGAAGENATNVIKVPAGSKGNWDGRINGGKLEPNTLYRLDNGHVYKTDGAGRVNLVEGDLSKTTMDRNTYQQRCSGKSGCVGDDGGHLIASSLGGSGDRINLVPQASTLNRGDWKAMERELAGYLKEGKNVSVKIDVGYPSSGGVRPNQFTVSTFINGKEKIFEFKQ
jgi:filamentous hemagglutinin